MSIVRSFIQYNLLVQNDLSYFSILSIKAIFHTGCVLLNARTVCNIVASFPIPHL